MEFSKKRKIKELDVFDMIEPKVEILEGANIPKTVAIHNENFTGKKQFQQ